MTYILLHNVADHYIGDDVILSDGSKGRIVFIDGEFISRPIISLEDGSIVDLKERRDLHIERMLYKHDFALNES